MEKFITLSKLLLIIFGVTLSISNNESSSIISSERSDRDLKNDSRFLFVRPTHLTPLRILF